MNWSSFIFFLFFISAFLFPNINEVGEVYEVTGDVIIKPTREDIFQNIAISGRTLYNGDLIHSSDDGKIQFSLPGKGNYITMYGLSELQINFEGQTCQLKLNYGNIFVEVSNNTYSGCSIITHSSLIILNEGELWITKNIIDKDYVYAIKGSAIIISTKGLEQHIKMGEMLIVNGSSKVVINKITEGMFPSGIFQRFTKNLQGEEEKPFTVINYFTDDSTITQAFQDEKTKKRPFNFTLEAGKVTIEKNQYTNASLLPMYTNEHLNFGYNLAGFLGISDGVENLNTFSTLSKILGHLIFDYRSSDRNYQLKLGRINNLTFGYGMLLKRYTNTINYPVKYDGGLALDFQSDAGNYTYQIFTSSLGELGNGGGLMGMYGTAIMSMMRSLQLGAGVVYDLNQFSSVPDSMWRSGVSSQSRSIYGYQVDFTYRLKSSLRNDTYLFGEFTALNYPDNLRYIRNESANGDTIEQGFERKNSFGILGPGIHWKLGHYRDVKIAFNYLSSLHIAPFFGETYDLERVHYLTADSLESIEDTEPYSQDEKWNTMITKNHTDVDSTAFYLPKDVYALLDPTRNVYNKMGISAEYNYHFRNYYQYSFDISIFKETGTVELPTTYYTLGMAFSINDGLIQGISECGMYFNQYYTSKLFDTSTYNENIVFGARLGIKILHNVSLRMYKHDVFYDYDLDGDVDFNSTMGVGMVAKF